MSSHGHSHEEHGHSHDDEHHGHSHDAVEHGQPASPAVVSSTDMLSQQLSELTEAITASFTDSRSQLSAQNTQLSALTAAIVASSSDSRSQLSALTAAIAASSSDSRSQLSAQNTQLSALTAAVTALSAFRSSPKSTSRSGGTSTPVVTGGSGSPTTNVARDGLRESLRVALRAAYAAASPNQFSLPFSPPLDIVGGTDSRLLPPHVQQLLFAHRFLTPMRMDDFDLEEASGQLLLQPSVKKGLSLFVVLSANLAVIAAAHAARGAVTRGHYGCGAQQLSELPELLTLTFDRVLEQTDSSPSTAIVWHATLAPKTPMLYITFLNTFEKWTKQLCAIEADAECPPSDVFVDPSDLHVLSSSLEPYFASKLAGFASLHSLQPAGGSPGT